MKKEELLSRISHALDVSQSLCECLRGEKERLAIIEDAQDALEELKNDRA